MISSGELLIVTPTIPQSIQALFNDHQARLAAVSAAPGVVGLSLDLDQISATNTRGLVTGLRLGPGKRVRRGLVNPTRVGAFWGLGVVTTANWLVLRYRTTCRFFRTAETEIETGTTQLCRLAYRASPKSILMKGWSPRVHASCPGGIEPTLPGPSSASDPSSIRTIMRPERTWIRWPTWQLSVPISGLAHSDHRHPGSWVTRLISTPPKSKTSILPF
jgi:hypothetical protein